MFETGVCDKCGATTRLCPCGGGLLFVYEIEDETICFTGFCKSCRKEIVEDYINELTTEELKKLYKGLPMSACKKLYEGGYR